MVKYFSKTINSMLKNLDIVMGINMFGFFMFSVLEMNGWATAVQMALLFWGVQHRFTFDCY